MPTTPHRDPVHRSRWAILASCVVLGVLLLVAYWIGDDPGSGVVALAATVAVGLVVFVGSTRNETIAGVGGPGRDERWALLDLRATSFAAGIVLAGAVGALLYEISQGRDGAPYNFLLAAGGISYVAALAVLRRRS